MLLLIDGMQENIRGASTREQRNGQRCGPGRGSSSCLKCLQVLMQHSEQATCLMLNKHTLWSRTNFSRLNLILINIWCSDVNPTILHQRFHKPDAPIWLSITVPKHNSLYNFNCFAAWCRRRPMKSFVATWFLLSATNPVKNPDILVNLRQQLVSKGISWKPSTPYSLSVKKDFTVLFYLDALQSLPLSYC